MSENDNKPSKQTSSVPLKKETVRVTLKAADAPSASPTGAPPAPAAPKPTMSAPKPPTVATKPPTAPGAPAGAPPAPAPTIPLRTAGAPTAGGAPAPAPTIKLNTAPASSPGAPTVALKTAGAPSAPGVGAPSVALPKATVQLQPPTKPMGTGGIATQAATVQAADEEEESGPNPVVIALSVLGLLGAAAVLFLQVSTASIWINADDNSAKGEWSQLF